MSEQVRREHRHSETREEVPEDTAAEVGAVAVNDELREAEEKLLADIDSLLEESPEEFVRTYIQTGGQ